MCKNHRFLFSDYNQYCPRGFDSCLGEGLACKDVDTLGRRQQLFSESLEKGNTRLCARGTDGTGGYSPLEVSDHEHMAFGRCLYFKAGTCKVVFSSIRRVQRLFHMCNQSFSKSKFILKEPEAVIVQKSQQSLPVGLFNGVE